MCSSFLIAWTPYAIVSLYSALTAKEEHGEDGETALSAGMSGFGHGRELSDVFGFPFLINWTSPEHFGDAFGTWRNATPGHSRSSLGHGAESTSGSVHGGMDSSHYVSSLSPEVTLIPTIFAKSHCMINPFIYQIMNRDFREDVYDLLCLRVKDGERRRARSTDGSDSDGDELYFSSYLEVYLYKFYFSDVFVFCTHPGYRGSISLSYIYSWKRRSTSTSQVSGEHVKKESSRRSKGKRGSSQGNAPDGWASLDTAT